MARGLLGEPSEGRQHLLRPFMKIHRVQTGVGHYGVFSGRRWANEVYPVVRDVIHVND